MPSKNSIDDVIEHYKRDVDLSLLKENLKLTPTERVMKLEEFAEVADEFKRAGRTADGHRICSSCGQPL